MLKYRPGKLKAYLMESLIKETIEKKKKEKEKNWSPVTVFDFSQTFECILKHFEFLE